MLTTAYFARSPKKMHSPITALPGVGPKRAEMLTKLGIITIEDLLRHYPLRYEDRRQPVPVRALAGGTTALIRVRVKRIIRSPVTARRESL